MNQKFLLEAYERHLATRRSGNHPGPEILRLFPYDLCEGEELDTAYNVPFVDLQIKNDLRSLINCLNRWVTEARKWQAWIPVLDEYDETDRWDLRIEFVDPIAHQCLLEPSAMRDRLLRALHFLLHHGNMSVNPEYKDVFQADVRTKKMLGRGDAVISERHMSRREFEEDISRLSHGWDAAHSVIEKLKKLDDESVREVTLDFRNAASHSIAPQFEFGINPYVTRGIRYAQIAENHSDGTVTWNDDKTHTVVSYGFGERDPLQRRQTFQVIRDQVKHAQDAIVLYEALLREVVGRIKAKASKNDHGNNH